LEQLRVKFDEVEHPGQCHQYYSEMAEEHLAEHPRHFLSGFPQKAAADRQRYL